MTNVNKFAGSMILAAAAAGFTAPAAAQDAAETATNCTTLAQNRSLSEFPAVNQAFVRNNTIGCKFIIDGDGRHALAQTFDFSAKDRMGNSMQERVYGQQLQMAATRQASADRQAEVREQAAQRNNDPVRDMTRKIQEIKGLKNILKGF